MMRLARKRAQASGTRLLLVEFGHCRHPPLGVRLLMSCGSTSGELVAAAPAGSCRCAATVRSACCWPSAPPSCPGWIGWFCPGPTQELTCGAAPPAVSLPMRSLKPPTTLLLGTLVGTDGGGAARRRRRRGAAAEQLAQDQGAGGDRDRRRQIAARNRVLQRRRQTIPSLPPLLKSTAPQRKIAADRQRIDREKTPQITGLRFLRPSRNNRSRSFMTTARRPGAASSRVATRVRRVGYGDIQLDHSGTDRGLHREQDRQQDRRGHDHGHRARRRRRDRRRLHRLRRLRHERGNRKSTSGASSCR